MEDLYPNDGTHYEPSVPEEQKREENAEKAKVQEGIQLLEEIISRWDERIRFYDSLDSINVDVDTRPAQHRETVRANKQTKANLLVEKDYLEGLRSQYSK